MAFVVPLANLILPLVLLNTLGKATASWRTTKEREPADRLVHRQPLRCPIFLVIGIFMLIALGVCLIVFRSSPRSNHVGTEEIGHRYPLIFRLTVIRVVWRKRPVGRRPNSGDRIRTCDLRVMSPTSYRLLYPQQTTQYQDGRQIKAPP